VLLEPHSSLTAFIQPDFNKEGYATSACYMYDISDPSTHYCTNTSVNWVR